MTDDNENREAADEEITEKGNGTPEMLEGCPPELLADLVGKKSKPTEMIQWVAASMIGPIDYETCPGMDAFGLLIDCRLYPKFRIDFWKSMYTKMLPNRSVFTDEDSDDDLDGSKTMEVLLKIMKIAAKAEKKAGGAQDEKASEEVPLTEDKA